MKRTRVFISSVQTEFAEERRQLFDYLTTDALLGRFFEPFIFEKMPAVTHTVSSIYIREVEQCDIYLGLFGKEYGYIDQDGISPTEREFDHALLHHKTCLIFLSDHTSNERHPKELALIKKAEQIIVRKSFSSLIELKTAIYASLIRYLEDKEYIRYTPFDATLHSTASLNDLDIERIKGFVHVARAKRNFPLSEDAAPETILTHLNLLSEKRLNNAAILLFGKQPQKFFISSEVKCVQFHGTDVEKPIPAYQIYKGDVFQLVNQAVDFVLSRIDARVGTRDKSNQVDIDYELPRGAVTEAIVNAIAHRDYRSNGSVQVMLFRDRLEVSNPGSLPYGLSPAKLRLPHSSIPANPLLAESMYLNGFIEKVGTGTGDIIRLCDEIGLRSPDFIQEEDFKTIIWRTLDNKESTATTPQATGQATGQVTGQATGQVAEDVKRVVLLLSKPMRRSEIQKILQLKHREHFYDNFLNPALELGVIELLFPEIPNHPNQKYKLTTLGEKLQNSLLKEIDNG